MPKRKTDAEFKKEVYDLVGNEYEFLEPYVNSKTKLKVKHNKCEHIYEVKPNVFLRGSRCPHCSLKARVEARRKTDTQFKQEVKNLVGNEYTFLEPYVNADTKLRVKHNKCGNIYKVKPHEFLGRHNTRCPYCYGNTKKTDTQFKQKVFELVGSEYTFLDSYVNARTKIKVKHNKCGNIYEVQPCVFLQGHGCPYCYDARKTNTQFQQEVYNLVGNEYTFLDTYVNNHTKLMVKHNKCGNVYEVRPNSFLRGNRCPCCNSRARGQSQRKTNVQFKQEVKNLVGDEYTFLDTYVNANIKIKVKHNKCGNIYEVQPCVFLQGHGCPQCAVKSQKKTDAQFKKEVKNLVGDEYKFLDSYQDAHTKLRVKHTKCGNTYEVKPNAFLYGSRCPYCNNPKGEVIINKILDSFNINYEPQKTFDDLKDIGLLSYDFYIPDQNILIEYQGRQHYQPVDYFGGEAQFKVQQKHDKLKSDYAKGNGYKLIAVPYTEDTFSKIKKYLVKHGLEQHLKNTPKKDAFFHFTFA